jgi:hypothetical protein
MRLAGPLVLSWHEKIPKDCRLMQGVIFLHFALLAVRFLLSPDERFAAG